MRHTSTCTCIVCTCTMYMYSYYDYHSFSSLSTLPPNLSPCSLQTVFVTQYLMDPRALRQKAISREDRQANDQIKMMIDQRNASRWYVHVHVHCTCAVECTCILYMCVNTSLSPVPPLFPSLFTFTLIHCTCTCTCTCTLYFPLSSCLHTCDVLLSIPVTQGVSQYSA